MIPILVIAPTPSEAAPRGMTGTSARMMPPGMMLDRADLPDMPATRLRIADAGALAAQGVAGRAPARGADR